MAYEPVRVYDVRWAFSTKKETAYGTLVADANLNKSVHVTAWELPRHTKELLSDLERFGKTHEWAEARRALTRDLQYTRAMELSSFMAGWAAAFGMGNVTSVQPNAGVNPTAWRHTVKFQAASTSKQPPVTTIYEEDWAQTAFRRKLESMALESFTIAGRNREPANLAMSFIGSGKVTTGAVTLPALSALAFLDMGNMLFKIGPQGAAVDTSERLIEFSVTIGQALDAANGYFPGSGAVRKRIWFTRRTAALAFSVFADAANTDFKDLFENETLREISFKITGATIGPGPEVHDCEIKFPGLKLVVEEDFVDGKVIYRCTAGMDDIYKNVGGTPDEPAQIVVTNTEASYLTT